MFLLILLGSLSGCESGDETPWWDFLVNQCSVNADQRGSFMAPLHNSQITLIVDNQLMNDPTHGQEYLTAIQSAARRWNDFGQKQKGSEFFTVTTGDVPDDLRNGKFSDCKLNDAGDENHFYLMLETNEKHWTDSGFNGAIPAATVRCYENGSLTKQVIMVNPSLVQPQQFMSVVVHEMGHSIGLDHSCTLDKGSASYISCASLTDAHDPYELAVMFPMLITDPTIQNTLAIKEDLQSNDTERASCFYK